MVFDGPLPRHGDMQSQVPSRLPMISYRLRPSYIPYAANAAQLAKTGVAWGAGYSMKS